MKNIYTLLLVTVFNFTIPAAFAATPWTPPKGFTNIKIVNNTTGYDNGLSIDYNANVLGTWNLYTPDSILPETQWSTVAHHNGGSVSALLVPAISNKKFGIGISLMYVYTGHVYQYYIKCNKGKRFNLKSVDCYAIAFEKSPIQYLITTKTQGEYGPVYTFTFTIPKS